MSHITVTIDSLRVHPETFEKIVILRIEAQREAMFLPFAIGQAEFDALTIRMQAGNSLTPLTHDLYVSIIAQLGGRIDSIIISDFKDTLFYAKLILDVKGVKLELDCRPSDALNIALSAGVPMFIEEELLPRLSYGMENGVLAAPAREKPGNGFWALTTITKNNVILNNLRLS